jgi:predicted nucleic acid-binding protein
MKKKRVLCDTNIISSYLMNDTNAVKLVDKVIGIENIVISSVTYMELTKWLWSYKGFTMRQIADFKKAISLLSIIHIDRKISSLAIGFYENYKQNTMQIPDMLIGATALQLDIKLATFNLKDFKFLKGLSLYGI